MMIDLYCVGLCDLEDGFAKAAGCGIVAVFRDTQGAKRRDFGYVLGPVSAETSELLAARIALATILPKFRECETVIHSTSSAVHNVLSSQEPGQTMVVKDLRKWASFYPHLGMTIEGEQALFDRATELATESMKQQRHIFSESMDI